jgi:cytochrome c biogenesis protein CcdA
MPSARPAFRMRQVFVGMVCLVFGLILASFAWGGGFDRSEASWLATVGGSTVAAFGFYLVYRSVVRAMAARRQQARRAGESGVESAADKRQGRE